MTIFASASAPCTCGIQWRSMPKTPASAVRTNLSGSNRSEASILVAMFAIRTEYPLDSRCDAIVVKPIGYISKTGVDGIRSLTGPKSMVLFLKSMTLGGWSRIRSGAAIASSQSLYPIKCCSVVPDAALRFVRNSILTSYSSQALLKNPLYIVVDAQAMLADDYMGVAVFAIIALLFPTLVFFLSRYLRPPADDPRGRTTYECGEVPIGDAQIQFHFQYYIYAIIFVAFDLVTVFVLIWGLVFSGLSEAAKMFMLLFLGILVVGVTYALKKEEIIWI